MNEQSNQITTEVSTAWATVDNLVDGFFRLLPKLAIAIVVFLLFILIARVVRAVVERTTRHRGSANVGVVLGRLARLAILFLGLLIAVSIVMPTVGGSELFQLLGVGSVAIGFAFRDILQNFLAGILILLRQPFRQGDQIIYKGFEGTVEGVDTRATKIRTYDGRRIVIPNGEIYTNAVEVNTAYDARRSEYDVGIGYGDDLQRAARVILEAMQGVEGVLDDPPPEVLTVALAESSTNLRAWWWTDPYRANVVRVNDKVIAAIKERLDEAGIDMPFPTRMVLFHDQTEETDGDRTRQREGWPAGERPPAPRPLARALQDGLERLDSSSAPQANTRGDTNS